ncbi:MAG: hypothetical protein ABIQ93_13890, partial [Saprospiraceae bacterium]
LRDRAEFYLLEAKNGERNHQPHIVLFVAFLHLFRHLQDQLNGLTQQHLDYYYGEILQLEKRGDLPDRAHLVFQLAIGVLRDRLDAGTLFRAGKDEAGHDLLYALERDLTINQGKVAEIKTLYLSGRENNLAVIASAHEEIILDTDKKTEAPDKIDSIQPFYSLGKGGNPLAPIGFAIASMQFETSQSNRQYDLLIHCEPLLPAAFNDAFGLFRDNAGPAILQQTSDAGKDLIPIWDKHIEDISKYLAELFEISASTEKGWENIEEKHFRFHQASADELRFNYYKNNLFADFKLLDGDGNQKVVAPEEKQAIISIEFQNELVIKDGKLEATGKIIPLIAIVLRIGKKYPAITTSISGETPLSDTLPVLKMGFNREHTLQLNDYRFLYAFARLLVVKLVAVKTRADNVDKFKLVEGQNFAPVPNSEKLEMRHLAGRGVYLYSDEVFNKSIQKTFKQVVIDEGVRSARADSDLDEVVVTGHAFSQQNGYFTINLKNKNGASLTPASVVHYQDGEKRTSDLRLAGRENVKQQTDRYVWLDFPAVGEGEEYAELDISYEAVQTIFQADNFPLFETIVASGRGERKIINYFRMDDDLDQFFYLGSNNSYWPYRALHHTEKVALEVYVPVIPEGGNQPRTWRSEQQFFDRKTPFPLFPTEVLYPNFRRPEPIVDTPNWANGNLFIGVQDLQPEQMLSLLFQIIEGSEEDLKKQTPEIEWSYLSQNAWKRFPPGGVSFDSTRGDENSRRSLVQSGIVELQMPADATNTDSLVKSGFYWVRASGVEN